MILDDNDYRDTKQRKASAFIRNPNSVKREEALDIFCDLFDVGHEEALQYCEGRKFMPEDKICISI